MPVPPETVRQAARRGLDLREKYGRGGLSTSEAGESGIGSGVARARDLAAGDDIPLSTIKRMVAFFSRHEQNYQPEKEEDDGGPTAGTIAWLLWGGNAGRSWANKVVKEEENIEKFELCKVDDKLGIVFGWAIISEIGDIPYYDSHNEYIPEAVMLRDSAVFMEKYRSLKEMHRGGETGKVIFAFPLTAEIKKSLGIQSDKTGLLIGVKPRPDVLQKFKEGRYTGFSVGGSIEDWVDDG